MVKFGLFLLLCSATVMNNVLSEKILFITYFPSISHQYVFNSIWKELSLRGHQVTAVGSNPINDPTLTNLTEIDASNTYEIFKHFDYSNLRRDVFSPAEIFRRFFISSNMAIKMIVENQKFKKEVLGKPSDYYDLVIVENFNPTIYGIQHKFKAPIIAISSLSVMSVIYDYFGVSSHPVLYPDIFSGLASGCCEKSLSEKLETFWVTLSIWFQFKFNTLPVANEEARRYFGDDMPHIETFLNNASMLLLNQNPVFTSKRPYPSNVMEYYGVHLNKEPENLSKDLEEILNKSTNGVVYFSLGTNVRFDHVEGNVKDTILKALGALKYTVLCKWESDDHAGKPKNIVLRKWFPQQSVLAHPNVKVFVTQGGLQSAEEAISNGVPLVVIPFLGDQPMNAKILTNHGMAETIPPKTLTEELLRDTINKVASDEKYRVRAKELRGIFLDQPQSGIDKIIWWCEYVIRHKGAKHLRSPGADISLYEYFMLDVLAVILTCCLLVYIVLSFILRRIVRLLYKKKPKRD